MRSDMPHLLVERGHATKSWGGKGWSARCRFRNTEDEPLEAWVPPIRRPSFSENLAPLRRWLAAQVGRPWNNVFSEICAKIDRGNAVQYHILQHIEDDLAVRAWFAEDGRLWYAARSGRPELLGVRWSPRLYVCPRSGLVRRVKRITERRRERPTPLPIDGHDRRQIAGQWYECWWGVDANGEPLLTRKRQLSHREKRDLGLLAT